MSPARVLFAALSTVAVFAVLLFPAAGTLDWWRAWVFLGIAFVGSILSSVSVARVNPAVLAERSRPPFQKGQPLADKVLVFLLIVTFLGAIVLAPLDVFRCHLMRRPGLIVSSLGLPLIVVGWWVMTLALRENAFAAPVVKHMEERHQVVVDTGVYGIVRHPLYAGAILFLVGTSLWLESWAATLMSIVAGLVLAARITFEERFLAEKLEGYAGYRKRVRRRLIPHLW